MPGREGERPGAEQRLAARHLEVLRAPYARRHHGVAERDVEQLPPRMGPHRIGPARG